MIRAILLIREAQSATERIWALLRKTSPEIRNLVDWPHYQLFLPPRTGYRARNVVAHPIYSKRHINSHFVQRRNVTADIRLPAQGFQCPFAQQRWNINFQQKNREFTTAANKSRRNLYCVTHPAKALSAKLQSRPRRIGLRSQDPPRLKTELRRPNNLKQAKLAVAPESRTTTQPAPIAEKWPRRSKVAG